MKKEDKKENMSVGKKKLYSWLNKQMKIEMTDGRVLVGIFLCTDRDANVILGSCTEYLNPEGIIFVTIASLFSAYFVTL